jgi:hypothetical protein
VRPQRENQYDQPNDEATREPPNQMQRGHTGYDDHDGPEGKDERCGHHGWDDNRASPELSPHMHELPQGPHDGEHDYPLTDHCHRLFSVSLSRDETPLAWQGPCPRDGAVLKAPVLQEHCFHDPPHTICPPHACRDGERAALPHAAQGRAVRGSPLTCLTVLLL